VPNDDDDDNVITNSHTTMYAVSFEVVILEKQKILFVWDVTLHHQLTGTQH
jgi:hypothetical protein